MYLLNTDLTVHWVFGAQSDPIISTSLDVQVTTPGGAVTYYNNAIPVENFLSPGEFNEGFADYTFNANEVGLWTIVLTTGTDALNSIYRETKMFITTNDILTRKFIDGSLL